ncbi:hypothetical protein QBK99_25680 [Corticibacterium sp. UT-5YL-CI-8]|nr:hypothetical protein [Tianweitania sp. UT-5YL-CI-8]
MNTDANIPTAGLSPGSSALEAAREAARTAPLAKIYEDHKGRKFIGVHSDAWWKASEELMRLERIVQSENTC